MHRPGPKTAGTRRAHRGAGNTSPVPAALSDGPEKSRPNGARPCPDDAEPNFRTARSVRRRSALPPSATTKKFCSGQRRESAATPPQVKSSRPHLASRACRDRATRPVAARQSAPRAITTAGDGSGVTTMLSISRADPCDVPPGVFGLVSTSPRRSPGCRPPASGPLMYRSDIPSRSGNRQWRARAGSPRPARRSKRWSCSPVASP